MCRGAEVLALRMGPGQGFLGLMCNKTRGHVAKDRKLDFVTALRISSDQELSLITS